MLRALSRLGAGTQCGPRAPLVLPARGRKTRYDPPAKSKIGRVNMPPPVDPAEFFVLMERYQHYRQTVRALRCAAGGRWPSARAGDGGGGRRGCRYLPRLHPGRSSCPRCGGRRTRPEPGFWRSARP